MFDNHTLIETRTGNSIDAFVARPLRTPAPSIVMLGEIFGINPMMRETACSWATDGFFVVVPDLFWRTKRTIELDYEGPDRDVAFGLYHAFDHEAGANDVLDSVEHVRGMSDCSGQVFAIGYCLGGTLAWLAAARGDCDGAAAFYGTKIQNYLSETVNIRCPLSLQFGDADALLPVETIEEIERTVASRPNISMYRYPRAGHAFMNRLRPTYDNASARAARASVLAMLRK